jgi:hypothetical protein
MDNVSVVAAKQISVTKLDDFLAEVSVINLYV